MMNPRQHYDELMASLKREEGYAEMKGKLDALYSEYEYYLFAKITHKVMIALGFLVGTFLGLVIGKFI